MEEQLLEPWRIHNRINLYLLDAIAVEALDASLARKGLTVFKLFAHIHKVRLLWLKSASPELLEGIPIIEGEHGSREELEVALKKSGDAIESLLRASLAEGGKIKGFKPHPVAYLGYLISHESHHRGHIGWALKYSGHPLDKKTALGLWRWGVR